MLLSLAERRLGIADGLARLMTAEWFLAYTKRVLVPTLRPGDVVILDTLPPHKGSAVREAVEAAYATLLFLPPYSPTSIRSRTLSPTQDAPAQRRRRTVAHLWSVLGDCLDAFTPAESANYLAAAGYDAY